MGGGGGGRGDAFFQVGDGISNVPPPPPTFGGSPENFTILGRNWCFFSGYRPFFDVRLFFFFFFFCLSIFFGCASGKVPLQICQRRWRSKKKCRIGLNPTETNRVSIGLKPTETNRVWDHQKPIEFLLVSPTETNRCFIGFNLHICDVVFINDLWLINNNIINIVHVIQVSLFI